VNINSTGGSPNAPSTELSVPFRPNVATNPTATMIDGNTNGRMVSDRRVRRPRNSKRASRYASGTPSATLTSVDSAA